MTSEKLTAKLSDGTEHEFEWQEDDYYLKKYGARAAHLKPLKQEPPKELWINICGEAIGYGWRTKEEAETVAQPDCKTVRYTLPSEPEQKKPSPPKEVFLCVYSDGSVSATYLTAEDASKYALGLSAPYPVHRYTLAPEPESESAPKCIFCDKPMELISQVGSARNYSCLPCISAKAKKAQDKKPAREWWEIRSPDGRAYPSCTTLEWARKFLRKLEQEDLIIVHVREVVNE